MKHALLVATCTMLLVVTAQGADVWYGVEGPVPLKIDSLKALWSFVGRNQTDSGGFDNRRWQAQGLPYKTENRKFQSQIWSAVGGGNVRPFGRVCT